MKKIDQIVLLITCVILTSTAFSQGNYCLFKSSPTPTYLAYAYQPSSCSKLLEDLAPTSNDPVIAVNVKFWITAPTTNSALGAWTYSASPTTSASLQTLLDVANATYSSMPAIPNLPVAGTSTTFTNIKIKLVLKDYEFINDDFAYRNTEYYYYTTSLNDPNAVNVYLGTWTTAATGTLANTTTTYTYVYENERIQTDVDPATNLAKNRILFTPAWHRFTTPVLHDNIALYGGSLAHEVGHVLGLDHTTCIETNTLTASFDTAFVNVKSPIVGCCVYAQVKDAYFEATPPSTPQCTSDNLMSQDAGCNRYLSPQQAGVMHYTLRTRMSNLIKTSSYSDAMDRNPAFDYSVTANETFQNTNRYFKGNITVKTNKTLTIKCGVFMSRYAKIIVEPGAQLILDGGTITNISGSLWDGIHLKGDAFQPQLTPNSANSGAVLYQGMLRIKNGGTISQASIGVRNYYISSGGGGIIFGQNANFINNVVDVHMIDPHTGGSLPIASASWFYNCNFKTTGVIGDPNGATYVPNSHVLLYRVKGVKFKACVFQYSANLTTGHGNGIYSVDANYIVDKDLNTPCVFDNLQRGIYVNNVNPLKIPVISNSKFTANTYGAYFMNANYLAFQTNTVICPAYSNPVGVYLNSCKYYKIKNNQFSSDTLFSPSCSGVEVYKSKTGAHEIFRNTFSNLTMGINCMDDNGNASNPIDGLKMNCNKFNSKPNSYDVVLSYSNGLALPKVLTNQGEISGSANQFNLVRNIYGAVCNGNQNKWQIYSGSTVTINHGSNTNSLTAVTQPTASGCKSSYLNVVDKNITLDYATHCSLYSLSSGGTSTISSSRITNMNGYINDLKTEEVNTGVSNHFEIQSTVASKLNLFLTDTLTSEPDSIVSILNSNQGNMEDADIQTVYAYMSKGDYVGAQEKVNNLSGTRTDWAALLTKLILLEQDVENAPTFVQNNLEFFTNYAGTDNMDGQATAQALLYAYSNIGYSEPHALPEGVSTNRIMSPQITQAAISDDGNTIIDIYPNPTQNKVIVSYSSHVNEIVKIELRDLLGKIIYANFITNGAQNHVIEMEYVNKGMYLVTLTRGKEIIYSKKLIKE